jgi:tetratricopeptide (TPR) repeat protein
VVVLFGSVAGLALVAEPGRASLYSPDDPKLNIQVGPDGKGQPFALGDFKTFLAGVMNAADDRKKKDGKFNSDREAALKRIEQRQGKKLSVPETAALAADLLRVGRADDALNRLKPLALGRNPNYFVLTTLGHVHAARGELQAAVDYHMSALLDSEMSAEVKGLTKPQRDWIAKLDRDYVLPYYQFRLKESTASPKPNPADEDVYPLFPVAERNKPHNPVRFVNEAGVYQPGVLALAERAKLPPDAVAIVQQLLFWFPHDTRLYWLLAELYAADGKLSDAQDIMDLAVSEARQYGNRKLLVEHRAAVRAAVAAQPRKTTDEAPLVEQPTPAAETPQPPPNELPISMRTVLIYFGAVVLIGVIAFIRAMSRRAKGECGPVG